MVLCAPTQAVSTRSPVLHQQARPGRGTRSRRPCARATVRSTGREEASPFSQGHKRPVSLTHAAARVSRRDSCRATGRSGCAREDAQQLTQAQPRRAEGVRAKQPQLPPWSPVSVLCSRGRTFTTASTSTLNCGSATAASTMVVVFSLVAATAKERRRADTPAWLTPRTRGAAALRRTDATILHGAAAARRTGAAVRETAKGATCGEWEWAGAFWSVPGAVCCARAHVSRQAGRVAYHVGEHGRHFCATLYWRRGDGVTGCS